MKLALLLLLPAVAVAFQPLSSVVPQRSSALLDAPLEPETILEDGSNQLELEAFTTTAKPKTSSSLNVDAFKENLDKFAKDLPDFSEWTSNLPNIMTSFDKEDPASLWYAGSAVMGLSLLVGGLPFINTGLLGSVMGLVGASMIVAAGVELQKHSNGDMVTTGPYNIVRHPMYAGILLLAMGFSIVSNSATRLLLSIVLGYCLDQAAQAEEASMNGPDYDVYKTVTKGKYIPQELFDDLKKDE